MMIRGPGGGGFLKETLIKPTIAVDAGAASEKNIQWLKAKIKNKLKEACTDQ